MNFTKRPTYSFCEVNVFSRLFEKKSFIILLNSKPTQNFQTSPYRIPIKQHVPTQNTMQYQLFENTGHKTIHKEIVIS